MWEKNLHKNLFSLNINFTCCCRSNFSSRFRDSLQFHVCTLAFKINLIRTYEYSLWISIACEIHQSVSVGDGEGNMKINFCLFFLPEAFLSFVVCSARAIVYFFIGLNTETVQCEYTARGWQLRNLKQLMTKTKSKIEVGINFLLKFNLIATIHCIKVREKRKWTVTDRIRVEFARDRANLLQ